MMRRIMVKTTQGNVIKIDLALYRAFVLAAYSQAGDTKSAAWKVASQYGFEYLDALRLVTHIIEGDPLTAACREGCAGAGLVSPDNGSAGVGVLA